MERHAKSIRPFIGAKNYTISRQFYKDLGFEENMLSYNMSYFHTKEIGFYLQDAYIEDWINNTMVFMEVEDVRQFWTALAALELSSKYEGVKVAPVQDLEWGSECFLHDPSGVLWHFGEFNK